MKKGVKLLLLALCCAFLLAAAVRFLSPAAPRAVAPLPEIEEIWEIEDTHTLSETPLLEELFWQDIPLPRDETGTFYCCLGLGRGEEWPALSLLLPRGVCACFADDYLWDACGEAIAQGAAYSLLVYTESRYCYQSLVFTGLPILALSCEAEPEDILSEDLPAELLISAPEGAFASHARIHRRGGGSFYGISEKRGYRVEMTRRANGGGKVQKTLPWGQTADTLALLPIAQDETKIRERLGWELWNALCGEEEPFGKRNAFYCEVFLNGDYRGVYLALSPYDARAELLRAGAKTGGLVYRTAAREFLRGRPAAEDPLFPARAYRVFACPGNDPDGGIRPYALLQGLEDEAFLFRFPRLADAESFARYGLFLQACGLSDNVYNNLYLWSLGAGEETRFHPAPWDLDISFGFDYLGAEYENWVCFPNLDRALRLDCQGMRARVLGMWETLRETVFSLPYVTGQIERFAAELNDSGAMARDSACWETGQSISEPQGLLDYWEIRMNVLDRAMEQIADPGAEPAFLSASDPEARAVPIPPEEE